MLTMEFRRMSLALLLVGALGAGACKGQIGSGANGGGASNGSGSPGAAGNSGSNPNGTGAVNGGGPAMVNPGPVTATAAPVAEALAGPICRKVKNLLLGGACSDSEVATVQAMGPAGVQQLIDSWTTDPNQQQAFAGKLIPLFRNMFQQVGFTATQDFKNQLLQNGGFDFGPFGTGAVGDDVYFRLVQNLQDSFALTAWQMIGEGDPFSNVLTTQKFYMTTGLKSLYTQIEMPDDEPYNFSGGRNATPKLAWKLDYVDTIALTDALNPNSPNYMTFDDEKPATASTGRGGGGFTTCQGVGDAASGTTQTVVQFGGTSTTSSPTGGYAQLFQRLIGYTPRYPFAATPDCWEHASKPYMTDSDVSDWGWVTIAPKQSGDSYIQPYDLVTLRTTSTLKLTLPRVGFYTTPAFLALWNTNDSNQHRVTANQALLAALGQSFTSDSAIVPLSESGLDSAHTTTTGECYGCHKSLDPLRMFWGNQLDFNDRNDFVANPFSGSQPNPRPAAGYVDGFAFGDVNKTGSSMTDLGPLLLQVTDQDTADAGGPLPLFAVAITEQLCYWANSNQCSPSDPEFRRVAGSFVSSNYNFPALIKELFSSPLVTGATVTATFPADQDGNEAVPISISREAHLCAALSNRMGLTDLCALTAAVPTSAQSTTLTIAGGVAADAFSRGSQTPVTPAAPDLFYRAATEELCENLANQVVDATGGPYTSSTSSCTNGDGVLTKFVEQVMGINPADMLHDQAIGILETHCAAASKSTTTTGGGRTGGTSTSTQTTGLRSTFVLACESPTSLGIGL
jgi:hypothetical protein